MWGCGPRNEPDEHDPGTPSPVDCALTVAGKLRSMDREALLLTLRLSAATTAVLLVVALPLGWWLSHARGWVSVVMQALLTLPIVLPPTVLGFYLLVGLGPQTSLGRLITRLMGHTLAFSFAGLLIGSALYSLPFAVQPVVSGFRAVNRDLLEAASLLGAGPLRRFVRVTLPTSRGSVVTAAVLTFAHTVGEFGVVLMLGGNIPGSTRTLSISLYDLVQDGRFREANRTALLLMSLSLAALLVLYGRDTRRRRVG